jgi:DNA-binding GntR family transcriptional regulator
VALTERADDDLADPKPVDSTQNAYSRLRQQILTGALAPGTIVSQVRLASDLQTSRTPLREALRRLQTEGLIESDFNRRVRVAPLSVADLEALYAMRLGSEPLAVRLTVPGLSQADLDALAGDLAAVHAGADGAQPADIALAHRSFHIRLVSGVGDRFRRHVEDLWDQAERYRVIYQEYDRNRSALVALAMRDHEEILAAAQARDGVLCARRVAEHLAHAALTIVAKVDSTHDTRTIRESLRQVCDGCGEDGGR